jgi:hypothetical protein
VAGTPVHTYLDQLLDLEKQLAKLLGSDPDAMPKDLRVAVTAVTAMVAVVIRWVVDNSNLTNAQLSAAVNAAKAEGWADLPNRINPS